MSERMDSPQKERQRFCNKLVSNARAIITNEVAIPLGVSKMNKIIFWMKPYRKDDDLDLSVFAEYDAHLGDVPLGTDRLYWDVEKLIEYEGKVDKTNELYKLAVLRKCKEIIIVWGGIK